MQIKKKINNPNKLYIIFFSFVLFIIIIFSTSSNASSFKISNLEISEPFELNFNKEKVVEKGFTEAETQRQVTQLATIRKQKAKQALKLTFEWHKFYYNKTSRDKIVKFTLDQINFYKKKFKII